MTRYLVLIFAYHFPPENAIGGARPFRFSKYLSGLGYTCRVFTTADQAGRDDSNSVRATFVCYAWLSLPWMADRPSLCDSEIRTFSKSVRFRVIANSNVAQFAYSGGRSRLASGIKDLSQH
jgi:hypothetical protein